MPFHRTKRRMKPGPNSGYSSWAFVRHRAYAIAPEHYVRAYLLIQSDLVRLFEYVEPSDLAAAAYSYRMHELLTRTCIEIEANFKAILSENGFALGKGTNINTFRKVNASHHLSSYEVLLPIWNGRKGRYKPFGEWADGASLQWYQDYNTAKHDRHTEFPKANLETLLFAVGALLVLISSQFGTEDFSAGPTGLMASGYDYHELEPALGSLFRIATPKDWTDAELYDFDWQELENRPVKFAKFDYSAT